MSCMLSTVITANWLICSKNSFFMGYVFNAKDCLSRSKDTKNIVSMLAIMEFINKILL